MTTKEKMNSPKKTARIAGFLYLAWFVTFTFADNGTRPIGSGDIAAIVNNIMASEWHLRISFISDVLAAVLFLLSAWALYVLLKPVNEDLALLFVLLNLGGVAVQCISLLGEFAVLLLLSGADYLKVFQVDQLQALAILFLSLYRNGFILAQIFWGLWLLPLGYLVFKSGFLPRFLGILLMIDCIAILIWFFQFFLFPGYDVINYPGLIISFIAELSLALWLLIKGVNVEQWEKRVLETD
jgi:hypothetical protein